METVFKSNDPGAAEARQRAYWWGKQPAERLAAAQKLMRRARAILAASQPDRP